jgi:hypothetical protein
LSLLPLLPLVVVVVAAAYSFERMLTEGCFTPTTTTMTTMTRKLKRRIRSDSDVER